MKKETEIKISMSKEHQEYLCDVSACFFGLECEIKADCIRKSGKDLPLQVFIFIGKFVLSGVAYDLLKMSINKLFTQFQNISVVVFDKKNIGFSIKKDLSADAVVIPERKKEFDSIKNIDDLLKYIVKQNESFFQKIKNILYTPLFNKNRKKYFDEIPEGEIALNINSSFLEDFQNDAKKGSRWCEDSATHWAEILTFSFSKMIITFDLGILAFMSYMKEEFFNQTIFLLSVSFAVISLLILSIFMRSVIVKNINSLAERRKILDHTNLLLPNEVGNKEDADKIFELFKRQGISLRENLNSLNNHVIIWMPWQKIGVYLFYFSVLSVLIGIVF